MSRCNREKCLTKTNTYGVILTFEIHWAIAIFQTEIPLDYHTSTYNCWTIHPNEPALFVDCSVRLCVEL